ncbi:MAG TPA: HAD-IA family hydrolase [Patescibacteria group bacterium]|nr:HAD-IA family hydrolase [Patescibacteria group bacterium]
MIKAIVFDWHGVLDKVSLIGFVEILKRNTHLSEDRLLELIRPIDRKITIGEINKDQFIEDVYDATGINKAKILEATNYIDQVIKDEELWRLVEKLRKKYKLGILSDAPTYKTERIKYFVNLDRFFDAYIFSSDVGMRKDNPKMFDLICELLNTKPAETLFVDDLERNIERAKKLGFETFLYEDAKELENYFRNNLGFTT